MIGKSWTTKKVESVWRRMRAGTSAQTIAADMGCTVTNIHKRLRGAGYDPAGGRREDIDDDAKLILARRLEGKEFVEIAVELGMEPTRLSVRRVYMRLARYCERAEIKYPRAVKKRGHKRYSPASVEPLMIADAVVAINGLPCEVLPDLTDPATLGCLLALVREHHKEPRLAVVPNGKGWSVSRVWLRSPHDRVAGVHTLEAEALVAALEAAP
jgi:hypothetical protein